MFELRSRVNALAAEVDRLRQRCSLLEVSVAVSDALIETVLDDVCCGREWVRAADVRAALGVLP